MPEFAARNVIRHRSALRGPQRRARPAAQEPGPRHRRAAGRRAGRADAGLAGVLWPLLARGVPAADDGSPRAGQRDRRDVPGARQYRRGAGRRPRRRDGAAAQRQLGHGRGVAGADTYGTFTTVAERLKPESLYRRFIDYRESLGFEVLPLSGGERPPFEVLGERLRDNRVVCLMAERDLTRTGVQVDFFGEPTRMPAGPAKLAIETGAALLPAHCWYEGDDCRVEVLPAAGLHQRRRRRHHPGAGRPVRPQHRRPSRRLAHAAAAVAGRSVRRADGPG